MASLEDFTLNGITINTNEPLPSMGALSEAVICFVGTAPDGHEDLKLNEATRVSSASEAQELFDPNKKGNSTLFPAFHVLFQKVRPIAYAIVVPEGAEPGITLTNILGGMDVETGRLTGIEAIPSCPIKPTIIAAPGFNEKQVGDKLSTQAKLLYATPILDGPNLSTEKAVEFSTELRGNTNLIIADPWPIVNTTDPLTQLQVSTPIPASVFIAAAMASVDAWESPQGQAVAIADLSRPIGYSINDISSEHNILNGAGIITFASTRMGGFSVIGNRTCGGEFISHTGLVNALARKIEETSQPLMGKNLTKQFIDSVVSRLNNWIQSLVAQGAIPAASIYLHPTKNNIENYNAGRWHLVFEYARYSPNENMVYDLNVSNGIIEQFVESLRK